MSLSLSSSSSLVTAALPRHDPLITGLSEGYEDGDLVSVNCTTGLSSPPASVTWFVNGERMNSDYPNMFLHEENVESNAFHLQSRSIELHFHLDRFRHFRDGRDTVELLCSAQLDGLPSVAPRETIKFVTLRQNTLSNHPLMTYLADSGATRGVGGAATPELVILRLVVLSLVPLVVLVVLGQSTQLS